MANFISPSIESALNMITAQALSYGHKASVLIGMPLLKTFIVISVVFLAFRFIMDDGEDAPSIIKQLLIQGFIIGLLLWLLKNYTTLTMELQKGFSVGANIIVGAKTGENQVLSDGIEVFLKFVSNILKDMNAVWDAFDFSLKDIAGSIGLAAKLVLLSVILLILAIYVLFATFAFVGMFVASKIGLLLMITIGPMFIPFGIMPITRFMFTGWLRFLLGSSVFYLVAPVGLTLVSAMGEYFIGSATSLDYVITVAGQATGGIYWDNVLILTAYITALIPIINLLPKISMMLAAGMPHGTVGTGAVSSTANRFVTHGLRRFAK